MQMERGIRLRVSDISEVWVLGPLARVGPAAAHKALSSFVLRFPESNWRVGY